MFCSTVVAVEKMRNTAKTVPQPGYGYDSAYDCAIQTTVPTTKRQTCWRLDCIENVLIGNNISFTVRQSRVPCSWSSKIVSFVLAIIYQKLFKNIGLIVWRNRFELPGLIAGRMLMIIKSSTQNETWAGWVHTSEVWQKLGQNRTSTPNCSASNYRFFFMYLMYLFGGCSMLVSL